MPPAVLVVAGLLLCSIDKDGVLSPLHGVLVGAGYYGFLLYVYTALNGICYRFGAPSAWLFGIAQAACLVVGMPASALGDWLNGLAVSHWLAVDMAVGATVVGIVFLSMFMLVGRGTQSTWGITAEKTGTLPARRTSRRLVPDGDPYAEKDVRDGTTIPHALLIIVGNR